LDAAAGAVIAIGAEWVPTGIRWTPAGPLLDWCHLGGLRFTDPFFEQTVETAMAHPFNLLFRPATPLRALAAPDRLDLRPAGLIFHMSRCGSTLVAQMLASLPRNIVLSEPTPLDHVLRAPARLSGVTPDQVVAWLRGMTALLGRRRHPEERNLLIKFEGWHALLLPLILRAFPGVPWAFLYRRPVEVLASLETLRPHQMFPNGIDLALVGLTPARIGAMSLDHYAAVVLERICRAAAEEARHGEALLLEHRELPEAVPRRLLAHFGLACEADDLARMREVARFNAKQPALHYADDSEAKRRAATPEMRQLAETVLAPIYAELEKLRMQNAA
jgi:hypothetical protein